MTHLPRRSIGYRRTNGLTSRDPVAGQGDFGGGNFDLTTGAKERGGFLELEELKISAWGDSFLMRPRVSIFDFTGRLSGV